MYIISQIIMSTGLQYIRIHPELLLVNYSQTHHSKIQWASSITIAWTFLWYFWVWNNSSPCLQDMKASGCVKVTSYFAALSCERFMSLKSSSKSSEFILFFTFNIAALTFPSLSLLIWSFISAFKGETTITTGCDCAARRPQLILSRNNEGRRWNMTDFPYPVGKTATTSRPW